MIRTHLYSTFLLILLFVGGIIQIADAQKVLGTLTGKVLNEENAAVQAANISLSGTAYITLTDAEGNFILQATPGKYKLVVSRLGLQSLSREVTLKEGNTTNIDAIVLFSATASNEVLVTGKTQSQQLRDQGFQVNVIDLKTQYNTTSDINQVLNSTPGVRIREEGGLGSNFTFSLNGFSGNQVKFFLDGIPMDNFGASLTLNNFPVNVAERIEVYKGVVPISLGTDALGGAINIVTRSNLNYLDASYSIGSFNTHRPAISGAYTDKKTGFTVRLNSFYNYSDNDYKVLAPVEIFDNNLPTGNSTAPQYVKRFHDAYQSATVQVEVGVTGKKYADKLLLGLIASENNKDIQTGVTMEEVYGALRTKSHSIIPTLKYIKKDLLIKGLDATLFSAYNTNKFKRIDTTPRVYNWLGESIDNPVSGGSGLGGEYARTQNVNTSREFLSNANIVYHLNSWQSVSLNYLHSDFKRTSFDSENPGLYTNMFPLMLLKNVAGFGWNADLDHKWLASAFAKIYSMKAAGYQEVDALTGNAHYEATTFRYVYPGYGLATAYFITPGIQVKASYEHAVRLPESGEIFGDGIFVLYSPGLKPERSDNLNLGLRYTAVLHANHRFSAEAGAIYRNTHDFIRVPQDPGATSRTTVNQGKVMTTGTEGEISYAFKNILKLSVNGTYQRLVDKEEYQTNNGFGGGVTKNFTYNLRLPNIPYLFGNVNASFNLPVKKNNLSLTYTLNYVAHYYLVFEELGNPSSNEQYIIPHQFAHNAFVTYSMAHGRYNVTAECRNLTDNLLYDSYKLQKPGRSFAVKIRYFISKKYYK